MGWHLDDVIVAPGSACGSALRGLIRATGITVREFLDRTFHPDDPLAWKTARLPCRHEGRLKLQGLRASIPLAVHYWPTTRSYTGQPLIELHLPGSPPIVDAVQAEWCRTGARLARPGEFTLRAFLAGKLDLLQAEAVLGVIEAENIATLQLALDQLAGGISQALSSTRRDLLDLLADLEAGLDFVEEHLEFVSRTEIVSRIARARQSVSTLARQAVTRLQHGERPRIVLAGLPNAGKSTLFNVLLGRNAAIVSSQAGTTRDFLEAPWECEGLEFDLVDTAGLEETSQAIPAAAQAQRVTQISRAALIVWCHAADATPDEAAQEWISSTDSQNQQVLRVLTKADCLADHAVQKDAMLSVSAETGAGLDTLRRTIAHLWRSSASSQGTWIGMSAVRCQESIAATISSLEHAETVARDSAQGEELIAIELRSALDHLGRIVGAVYTDDLLDRIFSRFCIGK